MDYSTNRTTVAFAYASYGVGSSPATQPQIAVDHLRSASGGAAITGELPARGMLTFESEGNDNPMSRYFSRRAHVPSTSSGLTIGRGYDMRERSSKEVMRDLLAAGVPANDAVVLARAAGLKGKAASAFMQSHEMPHISGQAQARLFEISYAKAEADVLRIVAKFDVVQKYGAVDWEKLDSRIKDILIDLRFRGDYTPATREFLQPLVVANDVEGMRAVLSDRKFWPTVPADRFERRARYLA